MHWHGDAFGIDELHGIEGDSFGLEEGKVVVFISFRVNGDMEGSVIFGVIDELVDVRRVVSRSDEIGECDACFFFGERFIIDIRVRIVFAEVFGEVGMAYLIGFQVEEVEVAGDFSAEDDVFVFFGASSEYGIFGEVFCDIGIIGEELNARFGVFGEQCVEGIEWLLESFVA